jgi:tyrosine-protein kinase Etk/Wzc
VPQPLPVPSLELTPARLAARSVVMVTSPGSEPTRAEVAVNLATVCAEMGQRVVVMTTDGIDAPADRVDGREPPMGARLPIERGRVRRRTGTVTPVDVRDLLEDTRVLGVSMLSLRHFVDHPTRVVIRVPEVLDALREVVDVVILDVPSFLSVHHGEGLAPLADVVLVVGERRSTTVDEMRRTSAVLKRLGAPVAGMALTDGRPEDEPEEDDDEPHAHAAMGGGEITLTDGTPVVDATLHDEGAATDYAPPGFGRQSEQPGDKDAPPRLEV